MKGVGKKLVEKYCKHQGYGNYSVDEEALIKAIDEIEGEFVPDGKVQVIHQNGQPYGIRDSGGYLLFFPKVTKYTGQEDRYNKEIQECYHLAEKIIKAIK